VKHEAEIIKFLENLLKVSDLNSEERHEAVDMFLNESGLTIEYLSEQFEIGVKNGYAFDLQINLLTKLLRIS
jgi:hypothetical protein